MLFLENLQWADPASLKPSSRSPPEPDLRAVLVVGTIRTSEIDGDHGVARAATRIRSAGTPLTTLELGALEKPSVVALLCEALRVEPEEAAPLAETIQKKTGGNPFFVRRFLGYLHAAGLLVYDPQTGRWSWDIARVEVAEATANVVALLARSIAMLPAASRMSSRPRHAWGTSSGSESSPVFVARRSTTSRPRCGDPCEKD